MIYFVFVASVLATQNGAVLNKQNAVIDVTPTDDLVAKLDAAAVGDTLLLADGNYAPQATFDTALVISKSITIRAKTPGQAVLDGRTLRRVVMIGSGDVVLDGLKVTGGFANAGGGVLAYGNANVRIIGGTSVFGNVATGNGPNGGGGIYVADTTASVRVEGSSVFNNTAKGFNALGGGILVFGRLQVSNHSAIYSNDAPTQSNGGGLCICGSSVVDIRDSAIYSNSAAYGGGGLHITDSAVVHLRDSAIYGNSASSLGGGLRIAVSASVDIRDLTIYGNSASNGGGLAISNGSPIMSFANSNIHTNDRHGFYVGHSPGTANLTFDFLSGIYNNTADNCEGFADAVCNRSYLPTCTAPSPPPPPPPYPGSNPWQNRNMFRIQEATWFSDLANSDVADQGGEACYLTTLFDAAYLPNPVMVKYTIESFNPPLTNESSYANCPDLTDDHQPIPPPRTCMGGDQHKVGTTVCHESGTCDCRQGGKWYSLPHGGECPPSGVLGSDCFWRATKIEAVVPWSCFPSKGCSIRDCTGTTLLTAFDACKNTVESRKLCTPLCDRCDATTSAAGKPIPQRACNKLGRLDFDPDECISCLKDGPYGHGKWGWYAYATSSASNSPVAWACHLSKTSPPEHTPLFKIDALPSDVESACTCHYGDAKGMVMEGP